MSRGDTEIAMAALNQPSLRIRASLLSNMCAEPPAKSYPHKSRNVRSGDPHRHAKPAVLENEEMEDASDHETPTSLLLHKTNQVPQISTVRRKRWLRPRAPSSRLRRSI
ncbi:hypothetical protein AM588_10006400 [Phytophthora nicotianae]|uniref:Uncharacterized protein n=1 Tax=Phytophthora nicotianae TaxID=4792 RepID=A0A0W8D9G3_PHYNI|nr:hypothetical protein AM588_10006400 [Phytophthora nicotianae]